jgi:hypothetical protein
MSIDTEIEARNDRIAAQLVELYRLHVQIGHVEEHEISRPPPDGAPRDDFDRKIYRERGLSPAAIGFLRVIPWYIGDQHFEIQYGCRAFNWSTTRSNLLVRSSTDGTPDDHEETTYESHDLEAPDMIHIGDFFHRVSDKDDSV